MKSFRTQISFTLIILSVVLFSNCEKTPVYEDATARVSGEYAVRTYVINGDTLWGGGKDQLGLRQFSVKFYRKSADSVNIFFQTRAHDQVASTIYFKSAAVTEQPGGVFQLRYARHQSVPYSSNVSGGVFREVYDGIADDYLILPEGYELKIPEDPTDEGLVLEAELADKP